MPLILHWRLLCNSKMPMKFVQPNLQWLLIAILVLGWSVILVSRYNNCHFNIFHIFTTPHPSLHPSFQSVFNKVIKIFFQLFLTTPSNPFNSQLHPLHLIVVDWFWITFVYACKWQSKSKRTEFNWIVLKMRPPKVIKTKPKQLINKTNHVEYN